MGEMPEDELYAAVVLVTNYLTELESQLTVALRRREVATRARGKTERALDRADVQLQKTRQALVVWDERHHHDDQERNAFVRDDYFRHGDGGTVDDEHELTL